METLEDFSLICCSSLCCLTLLGGFFLTTVVRRIGGFNILKEGSEGIFGFDISGITDLLGR